MEKILELHGLLDLLRNIGIKKSELKLYIALLKMGSSTAQELSRGTNIPYSKIYTSLKKLSKAGWIVPITSERPEKFIAKPPKDILLLIKDKINKRIKDIERITDELQIYYDTLYGKTYAERPVLMVSGLRSTLSLAKSVILRSNEHLLIACPFREVLFNEEIIAAIKKISKNVSKKLLITNDLLKERERLKKTFLRHEIRYRKKLFGLGLINEKEVLLIVKYRNNYNGLFSSSDYFIDLAKVYFRYLWQDASKV